MYFRTKKNFMAEKHIGEVTHWYDKIGVAVLKLKSVLKIGDKLKIKHGEKEFEHSVDSMQIDHLPVESAKKGDEVAVKLAEKAKEGALIYKLE